MVAAVHVSVESTGDSARDASLSKEAESLLNPADDTTSADETTHFSDVAGSLTQKAIDEMTRGMVYASLAITDDDDGTLKKVGKTNPWQIEALKIVTGSDENAHLPLSKILNSAMKLEVDKIIDSSGVTKGGHFLDTQGYIAHNEKFIVLSYRCTTSAFDWLTNFNTTSSAWEIEEDYENGDSGFCSGFQGLCCNGEDYKPRVHTGFYNNFLASLKDIREHVEPLLAEDQPPRTLYVVGHSLGGGVATVAACYFLLGFDWTVLPHEFVCVTAGSPRSCASSMKTVIDERMTALGDSAKMYRLVRDRDVVPKVPPTFLAFHHLGPAVNIDEDGKIYLTQFSIPDEEGDVDSSLFRDLTITPSLTDDETEVVSEETRYERWIARVPKSLRDHMPQFYINPLFSARGISKGADLEEETPSEEVAPVKVVVSVTVEKKTDEALSKEVSEPPRKGFFRHLFQRGRTGRVGKKTTVSSGKPNPHPHETPKDPSS